MKVLQVISSAGLGGGERHVMVLASCLKRLDLAQVVLMCRPGGWLEEEGGRRGLPVRTAPLSDWPEPFSVLKIATLVRREGIELIHAHLNRGALHGRAGAWLAGVPLVVTVHGMNRASYYGGADRIVAVSRAVRDHLLRQRPGLEERLEVVTHGIEPPGTRNGPGLGTKGSRGEERELLLGCLGKLHPNKGQRVLLRALAELRSWEDGLPPWRAMLVGDGPDRCHLERMVVDLALGEAVQIVGERVDGRELLPGFDLLVVPSLEEAYGLAAVEALAAGVPVLAADRPGLRESCGDRCGARFFEAGSAGDLAHRMRRILQGAEDLRKEAAAAAAGVRARHDPEVMARALMSLYTKVLSRTQ